MRKPMCGHAPLSTERSLCNHVEVRRSTEGDRTMGRPQLLPNMKRLLQMRDEGLTQQQIADRVNEENRKILGSSFHPITRSAVGVAMHREGENGGTRPRYYDELPWSPVKAEHQHDHRQAMLRIWARKNAGDEKIPPRLLKEFESFERRCREHNAVIHYDPDQGWLAVKARPGIDTGLIRLTDQQIRERGLEDQLEKLGLRLG